MHRTAHDPSEPKPEATLDVAMNLVSADPEVGRQCGEAIEKAVAEICRRHNIRLVAISLNCADTE